MVFRAPKVFKVGSAEVSLLSRLTVAERGRTRETTDENSERKGIKQDESRHF